MASPQVENGAVSIADELAVAIARYKFTSVEVRMLIAVMNMTYRVGKTKSEISVDDLRYGLNEKRYRVEEAIESLVRQNVLFIQALPNGDQIIGIQKDFEKWGLPGVEPLSKSIVLQNSGNTLKGGSTLYKVNTTSIVVPKIGNHNAPPDKFLKFVLKEMGLTLGVAKWRKERQSAHALYKVALGLCHEPLAALTAMKDHFEDKADTNFRTRVNMPCTYMLATFAQWQKQIPNKPRSIRTDEEITGYRFRYDVRKGRWVSSGHKIKPI